MFLEQAIMDHATAIKELAAAIRANTFANVRAGSGAFPTPPAEDKSEAKPETKPEAKTESKPKPETKTTAKTKSEAKPAKTDNPDLDAIKEVLEEEGESLDVDEQSDYPALPAGKRDEAFYEKHVKPVLIDLRTATSVEVFKAFIRSFGVDNAKIIPPARWEEVVFKARAAATEDDI